MIKARTIVRSHGIDLRLMSQRLRVIFTLHRLPWAITKHTLHEVINSQIVIVSEEAPLRVIHTSDLVCI